MRKQTLNSTSKLLDNGVFTSRNSFEIKIICKIRHTEGFSFTKLFKQLGILAERLCRDATFIQAGAAYRAGLD